MSPLESPRSVELTGAPWAPRVRQGKLTSVSCLRLAKPEVEASDGALNITCINVTRETSAWRTCRHVTHQNVTPKGGGVDLQGRVGVRVAGLRHEAPSLPSGGYSRSSGKEAIATGCQPSPLTALAGRVALGTPAGARGRRRDRGGENRGGEGEGKGLGVIPSGGMLSPRLGAVEFETDLQVIGSKGMQPQ
jgi:hypothetical protein